MKKILIVVFSLMIALSAAAGMTAAAEVPLSEKGELILEDYSKIEIPGEEVEVSEESLESYLEGMAENLAGENAAEIPEVTDDLIAEYSETYFGAPLETVEEARAYIRTTLERNNWEKALMEKLRDMAQVVSYPEETYHMVQEYVQNEIAYYASQDGLELDEEAILSGYGSADDYVQVQTDMYVKTAMIIERILDDLHAQPSQEDVDAALEEYMKGVGFDAYVTVDEMKETAGETWLWIFTELQYKSRLVYDLLEDRVVITE